MWRESGDAQISSTPAVEPAMMDRRALGPFLVGLSSLVIEEDAMGGYVGRLRFAATPVT